MGIPIETPCFITWCTLLGWGSPHRIFGGVRQNHCFYKLLLPLGWGSPPRILVGVAPKTTRGWDSPQMVGIAPFPNCPVDIGTLLGLPTLAAV